MRPVVSAPRRTGANHPTHRLAGDGGFEPPHTDPEAAFLPLDESPIVRKDSTESKTRANVCTRPVDPVHLPPFRLCCEPLLVVRFRCLLAEGLVWPFGVVDGLPGSQLLVGVP